MAEPNELREYRPIGSIRWQRNSFAQCLCLVGPVLTVALRIARLDKAVECLSSSGLRKSEWYNDFVLACGVRDVLGTRLVETPSHSAFFGLHRQIGRSFADKTAPIVDALTGMLNSAVRQSLCHLFGPLPADATTELVGRGIRYYFHVQNGSKYSDQTGGVFANDEEAIAHASVLAAELKQDKDWAGFVVCVVDEDGRLVAHVPVG